MLNKLSILKRVMLIACLTASNIALAYKTASIHTKTAKSIIDIEYPQGFGHKSIDSQIQKLINELKAPYTNELPLEKYPKNEWGSESGVDGIKVSFKVKYDSLHIVSILFDIVSYDQIRGYPYNSIQAVNFIDGKEIKLKQLFKPNSDYLATLSEYCYSNLVKQKAENDDVFEEEAKSIKENDIKWFFNQKGLVIVFDSYRSLASAKSISKFVTVPYETLLSWPCTAKNKIITTAAEILVERYENWSHPVEAIFKKHELSLYKVHYSKDGTCPTFYLKFKNSPAPNAANSIDYQKIYAEIFKANSYYPYALVDEKDNLKINVGWRDISKKNIDIGFSKASSPSTCKKVVNQNSVTIAPSLEEKIKSSPFHLKIKGRDGKKFEVYLYAEDERKERRERFSCSKESNGYEVARLGHYYLYLYDFQLKRFLSTRTSILTDFDVLTLNTEAAKFFIWSSSGRNRKDIIFLGQRVACSVGNEYEAYSLSDDESHLEQYNFKYDGNKISSAFSGIIYLGPEEVNYVSSPSIVGYTTFDGRIAQYKFILSDKPKVILQLPLEDEAENT